MAGEREEQEGNGATLINSVPVIRQVGRIIDLFKRLPEAAGTRRGLLAALGLGGGFALLKKMQGAEGAPPDEEGAANTRDAIAPVQTPGVETVKAEVADLNAAAPVKSDIAAVRSKTVTEVPKEWRWYLKEVRGEFHVIINRSPDGKAHFLIKVIKSDVEDTPQVSDEIVPHKAPNKILEESFPINEREAAEMAYRILAKWGKRTIEQQMDMLTAGSLVRTKRVVFKRVTDK